MKTLKKFLLLTLVALSANAQTLKLGTSPGYPPFEYVENGKIKGFDIELVQKAAAILDYKIEIKPIEFDGLIAAIKAGKIDMIASGMHKTPEREKSVTFSKPYYKSKNFYVTLADNDKLNSLEDAKNITLGAQIGTMQSAEIEKLPVKSYLNADHMVFILATLQGKIDGFVLEAAVANGYMKNYPGKFKVFAKTQIPGEGVALAFTKGNDKLAAEFNSAIKQLQDNGEYDALLKKYNIE